MKMIISTPYRFRYQLKRGELMSKPIRTTPIGLFVIMVGLNGCVASGLHQVQHDRTSIDPGTAIVIFSVSAAETVEEQIVELGWMQQNGKPQIGKIRQKPSSNPLRIFALEIPADNMGLTIKIKLDREWYVTTWLKGLDLVTGQVTYVGRIEIQNIRFVEVLEAGEQRTTGKRNRALRPGSIEVGFSDQSENDLSILRAELSLLDEQTVVKQIPQEWEVAVMESVPNRPPGPKSLWELFGNL